MGHAGKISLADLTHLVIDEADTMFDESFIQDLKGVLKDVKVTIKLSCCKVPQIPTLNKQGCSLYLFCIPSDYKEVW